MMCERNSDRLSLSHPQLGIWPTTQACALTGNQTGNLSVCRLAQSSEPHQPRQYSDILKALLECWKVLEHRDT